MPKPRNRQRIVFCDCVDCVDRPQAEYSIEQLSIADAVARQLPPPKAIILFGSGLLDEWEGSTNLDASSFPHLDRIVKDGSLGILALEAYTGEAVPNIFHEENTTIIASTTVHASAGSMSHSMDELAQLLGVSQAVSEHGWHSDQLPSLPKRFKGISALFASPLTGDAHDMAKASGMTLLPDYLKPCNSSTPSESSGQAPTSALPPPDDYTRFLLSELGEHGFL